MHAVATRHEGPLAILELARPDRGNALDATLVAELTAALADARSGGARAAILLGRGQHFCTGADLGELARLADAPADERLADALRLAALYAAVLRAPLLTAAAVSGAAFGGGLGLAAACDLVVAAPSARLQFSEVRLGFVPALISVFLPRRVAPAQLAALFLDPAPMDGAAGRDCGLVDEVAAEPFDHARTRLLEIARKASPEAVARTKRLLLAGTLPRLDEQLAEAARVNAEQRAHPECRRGVAHFLAHKSFPDWLDGM
ncbi:MAG: enoyl-CoA hydratase/isomerase family protein [Acidobacteriota bacterium]